MCIRDSHSNYINYFEVARVEMLRQSGISYRMLEDSGVMLVVASINCSYIKGAMADDLLTIKTTLTRAKGVRIHHHYEISLDQEPVATGDSVVAAVDASGKVVRLPKWLQLDAS